MSKLVVEICKIESVSPVEKADKLDVVQVKGWQCVVSREQFKVGDLVVYCPPDSIIPEKLIEKYKLEFLRKNGRVGTIKLRGQISQGLVLDLNCLPDKIKNHPPWVGCDVAVELGITKYEPPEAGYSLNVKKEKFKDLFGKFIRKEITFRRFLAKSWGLVKDKFRKKRKVNPFFDVYTDIENIKNFPNVFQDGEEVVITEKIHGTNARYANLPLAVKNCDGLIRVNFSFLGIKESKLEFCFGSHKVQLGGELGSSLYGRIAERLGLSKKLPAGYVFYGEIYGKGVQDITYGMQDTDVRFFDIKDISTGKYLDFDKFMEMSRLLSLPTVHILYKGKFSKEIVKQYTEGKSIIDLNSLREGCVIKPAVERVEHMGRVVLKSINSEYLLRKSGTEYH